MNSIHRKKHVFGSLVVNEIVKFYSTKLMFIVVIMIFVGVLFLALGIDSASEEIVGQSSDVLKAEIQELSDMLSGEYGFIDGGEQTYVNTLKIKQYMLDNNLEVVRIHSIGNLVLSLNQMFSIIVVIMILGAGKIWSDEFSNGTLSALVSKPVGRMKIFGAKFVTLLCFCILIETLLGILTIVVGGVFWGFDGLKASIVTYHNGIVEKSVIEQILYFNFYNFFTLLACAVMTIMITLFIRNGIIATCVSEIIYMMGSAFVLSLSQYNIVKYTLLANIQFQIYMDGNEIFKGMTLKSSVINVLVHVIVMLSISLVVFKKKNADE